jgi:choline dehydrogenase
MAYQRGSKDSYNRWASLVGDTSYTWTSFLPYLQKSVHFTPPDARKRAKNATASYELDLLGPGRGTGPLSLTISNYAMAMSSWVQKGLAEIGVLPSSGFTSGTLAGSAYVLETIDAETQTRETSETAFLRPAMERGNVIVFPQALAKKVVFDGAKRATGVVVDTAGKKYTINARREVVLSAGAFQSPQLLMVSGVGPRATLERVGVPVVVELPGVGQNMWVSAVPMGVIGSAELMVCTGSCFLWPQLPRECDHGLFDGKSAIRREGSP